MKITLSLLNGVKLFTGIKLMASKERIQRMKEDTRAKILDSACAIVRNEGWQALSMRKIADQIEYTAPIIYEYFSNKEAILAEINRMGFVQLAAQMKQARDQHRHPAQQLEAMWMAYWDFAFTKKELYQLMFGVSMNCCPQQKQPELKAPELEAPANLVRAAIGELMGQDPCQTQVCRKYFTFWSVIHGLISINLVNRGESDQINQWVLKDAIEGITRSITG